MNNVSHPHHSASGSPRRHRHRHALFAACTSLLIATAACGDSDAAETVDLAAQYCDTVDDVNAYAEGLFADLESGAGGEEPTLEEIFALEREIVAYMGEQGYDEMALPPEIADDFHAWYAGYKEKLEAPTPIEPSAESQAAEERLLAWEDTNCQG